MKWVTRVITVLLRVISPHLVAGFGAHLLGTRFQAAPTGAGWWWCQRRRHDLGNVEKNLNVTFQDSIRGCCWKTLIKNVHLRGLHPGRLTSNIQSTHFERKMIFQTSMILFHVNLPGCMSCLWIMECPTQMRRMGLDDLPSREQGEMAG